MSRYRAIDDLAMFERCAAARQKDPGAYYLCFAVDYDRAHHPHLRGLAEIKSRRASGRAHDIEAGDARCDEPDRRAGGARARGGPRRRAGRCGGHPSARSARRGRAGDDRRRAQAQRAFSADANFAWIGLQEPDKRLVQEFKPGADFPRRATVDAIDYAQRKAYAVVVDVKTRELVSASELVGLQPGLTDRDTDIAKDVLDADPRVKAALVGRGLDGAPQGVGLGRRAVYADRP